MNREVVAGWSMCFVLGLGVIGCGQDPVVPGESFIDPTEEAPESANNVVDEMEPTVEQMPDPAPDPDPDVPPIAVPAVRCTTNVVAENPFAQQLPGWDRFEFDVQIAPETRSFLLVGYNERGNGAMIEAMTKPGGDRVDYWLLDGGRMISTWYYTTAGSVSALSVPSDPQDLGRLEPGTYTFEGISQDAQFCYYVVEDTAPGSKLRLNMFFVGSELRNNVERNEDWQVVEEVISNTFASAGIEVEYDYREVPDSVREDYAIPRSINDLDAAVIATVDASEPLPMRSIDVFIWDEFDGEAGQMHGMARGIPEAVGLHGQVGNGVVFQLAGQLGFEGLQPGVGEVVGNFSVGLSIAHEIAHLLGLFHTSEFYTTAYDSLADTPQCEGASQTQDNCPDASNLMFPIGPLYESSALTDQQVAVMTAHPSLIRD